ncbi:MAG: pseudaminic acid cytidylyltransferase [Lachnospiraceae bacterium]|nr:pseudaminic acid cytidylyltransferase [Lachnospiraceae bacterium]
MKKIAIITARGGSKRIPRKNIKEFCGKPILAYSIEAALESGIFDEVMVSTDDQEIADIARKYGASVPFFRSEKTSGDFATAPEVVLEVLEEYEKRGEHYDIGLLLYPTAPFVTAAKLKDAAEKLLASDADTLVAVVQFSYPPQRGMIMKEGRLVFEYPQYLDSRSQDLEPHYHDVGQFLFFHTEAFKQNRRLLVGNLLPYVVSEMEVQDIDNQTDWEIAEMKYRVMKEKEAQQK